MVSAKEHATDVLSRAEPDWAQMGEKTVVLCLTLPSGYELTVSSAPEEASDFDEKVGKAMCLEKAHDRLTELLAFDHHGREGLPTE